MVDLPPEFDPEIETDDFLIRMKRRASKNFKGTREPSLAAAAYLAYWLHLFHRNDDACAVCAFLSQFEFTGDHRRWSWIANALALGARLHRLHGDPAIASANTARILAADFVERRLSGALLNDNYRRAVDFAVREGTPADERDARLIYIAEICVMNELGGSDVCPPDSLEQLYQENAARLRELVGAPAG